MLYIAASKQLRCDFGIDVPPLETAVQSHSVLLLPKAPARLLSVPENFFSLKCVGIDAATSTFKDHESGAMLLGKAQVHFELDVRSAIVQASILHVLGGMALEVLQGLRADLSTRLPMKELISTL